MSGPCLSADEALFGFTDARVQEHLYFECTAEQRRWIDQVSLLYILQAGGSCVHENLSEWFA